jgi:hypothetical protein
MGISKKTLNASRQPGNLPGGNGSHYSVQLLEKARADTDKTWFIRRFGEWWWGEEKAFVEQENTIWYSGKVII